FLVTQAPHLVHHFFEPDHVQNECLFAANGERTGGLQIEPVAIVAVSEVSTPVLPAALFEPGSVAHATPLGRAPPARHSCSRADTTRPRPWGRVRPDAACSGEVQALTHTNRNRRRACDLLRSLSSCWP